MSDEYKVGYGKPPKHTRFQKGQSGNPKGRPKGHRNFRTDVREILKSRVQMKENGRTKKVPIQWAVLLRLIEKALRGDVRAIERLIELARFYNDEELESAAASLLAASDQDILDAYVERKSRSDGKPPANDKPTPRGRVRRKRLRRLRKSKDDE